MKKLSVILFFLLIGSGSLFAGISYTCARDVGGCTDTTNSFTFTIYINPSWNNQYNEGVSIDVDWGDGQSFQWSIHNLPDGLDTLITIVANHQYDTPGIYNTLTLIDPVSYDYYGGTIIDVNSNWPYQCDIVDCSVTATINTIQDAEINNNIEMYPNPAQNTIVFNGAVVKSVQIIDLAGKTVLSTSSLTSNNLSIDELTNGMYHVILETEKGTQKLKLVVSK